MGGVATRREANAAYHTIGGYGSVNLDSYGILGLAPEFFNLQMLLQPLEEQLYMPSVVIQFRHFQ